MQRVETWEDGQPRALLFPAGNDPLEVSFERVVPKGKHWSLEEMHELVGGHIEMVPVPPGVFPTDAVEAVGNESGRLKDMPHNFWASLLLEQSLMGPIVITHKSLIERF